MNDAVGTRDNGLSWINPVGGMGDMLMVSGVIKQILDHDTSKSFNLVRRTAYREMFKDHPAIHKIGYPPRGSHIIGTDYWKHGLGKNDNRPYQILARLFGLPTPAEEILYFPGVVEIDPLLEQIIPWGRKNVMIMTGSDSPRKMMSPERWQLLVAALREDGVFVIQTGRLRDTYIPDAYSLLGLTSLGQLIALLKRVDLIITVDTLAMHAAHLVGTTAIALWGPTDPEVYGYPGQYHFRHISHCDQIDRCIGPGLDDNYGIKCPLDDRHCMSMIPIADIHRTVHELLGD